MTQHVYFARAGDRIKIGVSRNVAKRLKDVGAHLLEDIVLLGTIVGSDRLERAIHARLKAHRVKNEWFADCPEVRSVVALLLDGGAAAIGFDDTPPERIEYVLPVYEHPLSTPFDAFKDLVAETEAGLVGLPKTAQKAIFRTLKRACVSSDKILCRALLDDSDDDHRFVAAASELVAATRMKVEALRRGAST